MAAPHPMGQGSSMAFLTSSWLTSSCHRGGDGLGGSGDDYRRSVCLDSRSMQVDAIKRRKSSLMLTD